MLFSARHFEELPVVNGMVDKKLNPERAKGFSKRFVLLDRRKGQYSICRPLSWRLIVPATERYFPLGLAS